MHVPGRVATLTAGALIERTLELILLGAALAGAASMTGCKDRSPCEQPCVRVAVCKLESLQGAPVLGEKRPPPDPDCLRKCETQPEEFEKCEATKRLCPEIRACHGPFR